jgi:hypothetical protein
MGLRAGAIRMICYKTHMIQNNPDQLTHLRSYGRKVWEGGRR